MEAQKQKRDNNRNVHKAKPEPTRPEKKKPVETPYEENQKSGPLNDAEFEEELTEQEEQLEEEQPEQDQDEQEAA